MREVALWAVLLLTMIAVAFYCGQLIEELTGRKTVAKFVLVAIAFAASMLVRGGVWLARRLRSDATMPDEAALANDPERLPPNAAHSSGNGGTSDSAGGLAR